MSQAELDARGLTCPMPVLKAQKAMKSLKPGDELVMLATDPAAPRDVAAFCDAQGHSLVTAGLSDGVHRFVIRKGG